MVKMWLDDIRDPRMFGCPGWVWVTTPDEAIKLLATGTVEQASLDHDLTINQMLGLEFDDEQSGYKVVCWMEENNVWPINGVSVHSMNPAGKARMEQVIAKYGKSNRY